MFHFVLKRKLLQSVTFHFFRSFIKFFNDGRVVELGHFVLHDADLFAEEERTAGQLLELNGNALTVKLGDLDLHANI